MIKDCPSCRERVFFSGPFCPSCGRDSVQPVPADSADIDPALPRDRPALKPAAAWGALALIVLAIFSFLLDWSIVSKGGSIDYRNRVTGLRLMVAGEDAYHYKWTAGKPEQFCDLYENPALPITKTTATPATLVAGWPWALLPYPIAKTMWFLVQWALLAGLWFLWLRWPEHSTRSRWWWTIFVVGFTYTLAWRHHIDRGQAYVLWVFLLAGWMRLSVGKLADKNAWLPGLVAGLLISLRPPLLLVIAPFIALRRRNQGLSALAGILLGLGVPAFINPSSWADYGKAMQTWSEIYRTHREQRPGARVLPPEIEGMSLDLLARYNVPQYMDSSLFRLGRTLGAPTLSSIAMLAALGLLFCSWLWLGRRVDDAPFMLGLAAWSFLLDAFLPAYRNPYNDVMILNLIALFPVISHMRGVSYGLILVSMTAGIWIANNLPAHPWPIYVQTLAFTALAMLALRQSAAAGPKLPSPPASC